MTIFRLNKENFEVFSIQSTPSRSYISGSNGFKTGSVPVFPRASLIEREWIRKGFLETYTPYDDSGTTPAESVKTKLDAANANAILNITNGQALGLPNGLSPTMTNYQDVAGLIASYLSGTYTDPGIANLRSDANNYIFENINRIDPVKEISSAVAAGLSPYFYEKPQFTGSSGVKAYLREKVFPYHRSTYPELQFAYTNYNCLNFFTASSVQPNTVLLYPENNLTRVLRKTPTQERLVFDGNFCPSEAFTFDFYINPKYTTDNASEDARDHEQGNHFRAGTLFHLSSSYAVSLVTGSSTDVNGYADRYRIMLQLSRSADISPSRVDLTIGNGDRESPGDLIFLSDDNSLKRNHWHHVAIRWGTEQTDAGVGSFFVDGDKKGNFQMLSSSIAAGYETDSAIGVPNVLCVGNYYAGNNYNPAGAGNDNRMSLFFTAGVQESDGLIILNTENVATPKGDYFFEHPLNAEVHDLKIFKEYRSQLQIMTSSMQGPDPSEFISNGGKLGLYIPPFFTKESPSRTYHRTSLMTRTTTRKASEDPINVDISYRVGGREINLENFVRNFTTNTGSYPRLLNLTSSVVAGADTGHEMLDANDIMFRTGSHVKKCLTILPCDNGLFIPNTDILISGTMNGPVTYGSPMSKFVNDLNNLDLSKITLNTSMSYAHNFFGFMPSEGDTGNSPFLNKGEMAFSGAAWPGGNTLLTDDFSTTPGAYGAWPTNPTGDPNTTFDDTGLWAVFQEQGDRVSNEITIFSISNLFFGDRIKPGSFKLEDNSITGSDGKIKITLRDNKYGVLYRADALTKHSKNSAVGNIVYQEGAIVITSPHAFLYGKDGFNTDFLGDRNIHVLKIIANAGANMVNSSSNPNYRFISASLNANDSDQQFVYITGINYHDENLNVVMKTKLAQPVVKRSGDKILFKTKLDF